MSLRASLAFKDDVTIRVLAPQAEDKLGTYTVQSRSDHGEKADRKSVIIEATEGHEMPNGTAGVPPAGQGSSCSHILTTAAA